MMGHSGIGQEGVSCQVHWDDQDGRWKYRYTDKSGKVHEGEIDPTKSPYWGGPHGELNFALATVAGQLSGEITLIVVHPRTGGPIRWAPRWTASLLTSEEDVLVVLGIASAKEAAIAHMHWPPAVASTPEAAEELEKNRRYAFLVRRQGSGQAGHDWFEISEPAYNALLKSGAVPFGAGA